MPAIDLYPGQPQIDSPCTHAAVITPSDTTDMQYVCRSLFVGSAGNLEVITQGGEDVTFQGVQTGTLLPIRCTRVKNAGTTAGSIMALY